VILHGTAELDPPFGAAIVSFAEALNRKGIAAAIPRYFKATGTQPGNEALNGILTHLGAWKAACASALAFLSADARFDATRLGALGFSLGGHLALTLGLERPGGISLKAVVDFFAPTIVPPLRGTWAVLPPVLIHHGTADPLGIENSKYVVSQLDGVGRTVTRSVFGAAPAGPAHADRFIEYPGEGHGFKEPALSGSRDSTVDFLDAHLR
jgi:dienelactone hydrolase